MAWTNTFLILNSNDDDEKVPIKRLCKHLFFLDRVHLRSSAPIECTGMNVRRASIIKYSVTAYLLVLCSTFLRCALTVSAVLIVSTVSAVLTVSAVSLCLLCWLCLLCCCVRCVDVSLCLLCLSAVFNVSAFNVSAHLRPGSRFQHKILHYVVCVSIV